LAEVRPQIALRGGPNLILAAARCQGSKIDFFLDCRHEGSIEKLIAICDSRQALGQLDDFGRNLLSLSGLGRIEMVRFLQSPCFWGLARSTRPID
jgi:hypothetical protein